MFYLGIFFVYLQVEDGGRWSFVWLFQGFFFFIF